MRFGSLLSLVCAAVPLTLASVTPTMTTRAENLPLNPPVSAVQHNPSPRDVSARGWTNARRLAEGLPLNPPKRTRKRDHSAIARAMPSSTPHQILEGYLLMTKKSDGTPLGYISSDLNDFGEYGKPTGETSEALKVKLDVTVAKNGEANIETCGAPYPFFGAISGFSNKNNNFGEGSHNYAYIGGTDETEGGEPAKVAPNSFSEATNIKKAVQSAIFKYDPVTWQITAQWINEDSSAPATHMGYASSDMTLVLCGDKSAFENAIGVPVEWITLTFIPLDVFKKKN